MLNIPTRIDINRGGATYWGNSKGQLTPLDGEGWHKMATFGSLLLPIFGYLASCDITIYC